MAKGQLAAASQFRPPRAPDGSSGKQREGFVAATSKRVASKSGAKFDYYQNSDGSFTRRVFQGDVNYRDSKGDWQPVDLRLGKSGDGRWQQKANSFGVSFAAAAGGSAVAPTSSASPSPSASPSASAPSGAKSTSSAAPVRDASYGVSAAGGALAWRVSGAVQADSVVAGGSSSGPLATMAISPSESVSWSLAGASDVAAAVSGSSAEYDAILPDTNLVLQPTAGGVKETLVLASAAAPTSWVFPLQLSGLSLTTAADGTIELTDGSGAVVATLPKAYAYDSYVDPVSGERHENWSVGYSVETVDGSPAIRMSLDPSWLAGSQIQFPVTVDPTVALSTSGQNDTTYAEYPYSEDFSSSSVLKIGTYDAGAHSHP
ncbi:hypothetical protein [Streptacidiphilus cavernicola]|uniref:Htaa domain-containing protein n=1 Tax=Streptacidiphilus cavernicola TaxID=3342716 RepID=A0ABV6W2J9_9ACTN